MIEKSNNHTIGDYLNQVRRQVVLEDNQLYKLLGVKWYGMGMFLREEKYGKDIKADKLYRVKKGDFVYNRLFAWKSSFAIVEEEFDGCLVSNEFPTFEYNIDEIDPLFLLNYVLQPGFIESVNRASGGMSSVSRKRFKEEDFLRSVIPHCNITTQRLISVNIQCRQNLINNINSDFNDQSSLLSQLRQSILQEAIEGKLTADWRKENPVRKGDPDYDAEALLEKIKTEKEKLIIEGKIKKQKPLAPIKANEVPFELPEGWVWTRLGEICSKITDGTHHSPINTEKGEYKYVTAKNIKYEGIDLSNISYVSRAVHNEIYSRCNVEYGDVLYIKDGATTGIVTINNLKDQFSMLSSVALLKPLILNFYLALSMRSPYFFEETRAQMYGVAITRVTLEKIINALIPLPSCAEQKAIIDRVHKLLSIVDELDKQVDERKEQAEELMQAVLREAFEGGT